MIATVSIAAGCREVALVSTEGHTQMARAATQKPRQRTEIVRHPSPQTEADAVSVLNRHPHSNTERWAELVNGLWAAEIASGEVTTQEVLYIIWCESRGDPNARNPSSPHVLGLFQIDKRWLTSTDPKTRVWGKIDSDILGFDIGQLDPAEADRLAELVLTSPEDNAKAAKIISDDSAYHGQPRWSNWACAPE